MALKLNKKGYENARKLIREGHFVGDERDDWSEHAPSTQKQNEFLEKHGFKEYEKWFLGIDDEKSEEASAQLRVGYRDVSLTVNGVPVADPQRPVSFVFPEDWARARQGFAVESGQRL